MNINGRPIVNVPQTTNDIQTNIIELVSDSCDCSQTEAQGYLDFEIRYLRESQEADGLKGDDIGMACSSLGLDSDYQEYFISRLTGAQGLMVMTYFQNIHNMADLKKEYRCLALQYYPDKGGDTTIMQWVNAEFEELYRIWRDKPGISAASIGYEHDYPGATAREYIEYVYSKHRWKGRNYRGRHAPEIVEPVWAWLKEAYPGYKFSIRRENCHSVHVRLMKADFETFTKESGKVQGDVNHHHTHSDKLLTGRAKEATTDIYDFIMSYNFDDSGPMTDYLHTNFYLTLGTGSYKQPYKVEPSRLGSRGKPEASKHPEDPAHKAVCRALGKACLGFIGSRKYARGIIPGEDCFDSRGELYLWPKEYSDAKMVQKCIDKPEEAGIRCELTGYNEGYIRLLGHTLGMRGSLERECQEYAAAYQAWYSKQNLKTT